jgi:hypothetical protein
VNGTCFRKYFYKRINEMYKKLMPKGFQEIPRSSGLTQKPEGSPAKLFFRSRLWGDEAGKAIVDDKLAVVFAGMLDETIGHV